MTKPNKNHSLLLKTFDNKDKNIITNKARIDGDSCLEKIKPEQSSVSLAGVEVSGTQDEFTAKQIENHFTKEQDQKSLTEPSDTAEVSKTNPVEVLDERFRVLEEGWGYYSRKKKPLFYKIEIMRFE